MASARGVSFSKLIKKDLFISSQHQVLIKLAISIPPPQHILLVAPYQAYPLPPSFFITLLIPKHHLLETLLSFLLLLCRAS